MFNLIEIKMKLLQYFSKEKIYVCGDKVFDAIISDDSTIMPRDAKQLIKRKLPAKFDAIAFGKFWVHSSLVKEDYIMPLRKTIKLLENEANNLKLSKKHS